MLVILQNLPIWQKRLQFHFHGSSWATHVRSCKLPIHHMLCLCNTLAMCEVGISAHRCMLATTVFNCGPPLHCVTVGSIFLTRLGRGLLHFHFKHELRM